MQQLSESQHTRLPVYEGDIDKVRGMIHIRNTLYLFNKEENSKQDLQQIIREPY